MVLWNSWHCKALAFAWHIEMAGSVHPSRLIPGCLVVLECPGYPVGQLALVSPVYHNLGVQVDLRE